MTTVHDILAANALLVSVGGKDQMPTITAAAIETSLHLQKRIDRAIAYADNAPANSVHAHNIARILDGSITEADEESELDAIDVPVTSRGLEVFDRKAARRAAQSGLTGRSTKERADIRRWLKEQGLYTAEYGRIPQHFLDAYDKAKAGK